MSKLDQYHEAGEAFTKISEVCHGAAKRNGWWTDLKTGESLIGKRNVGEMLMLAVSEIAEAMEGHRKGKMDDKLPHRPMIEVELADCCIRLGDTSGALGFDLEQAVVYDFEELQTHVESPDVCLSDNVGESLMMITRDLSLAAQAHWDDCRETTEHWLARAILRIALLNDKLGLDVGGAITEKMAFNDNRPDHKPEARLASGGKAY